MDKRPKRGDGFEIEAMDDELLLYDATKERVVHMNGSCALVWQLADGTRTVGEMIRVLEETYPEAKADIPSDVRAALATLSGHGALALQ